uniref:HIG1 domain-containing protein n=1 Tax=Pelusios castaneus TaxID=367368 RepID=A0A8C8S050_9SAUR
RVRGSRGRGLGDRGEWGAGPQEGLGVWGRALTYGLICFRKGNVRRSQQMMRARVLAQGFTITAVIVGVAVTAMKSK